MKMDFAFDADYGKEFGAAYRYALSLLARREYSSGEIRQKLRGRVNSEMAEAVIAKLKAENSLSDERFVEMMVRHYAEGGYGPKRIALELLKRGIDKSVAQDALRQLDTDWVQKASEVLERKYRSYETKLQPNEQQKVFAFLVRRGFAESVAWQALKNFQKGLKAIDEMYGEMYE